MTNKAILSNTFAFILKMFNDVAQIVLNETG